MSTTEMSAYFFSDLALIPCSHTDGAARIFIFHSNLNPLGHHFNKSCSKWFLLTSTPKKAIEKKPWELSRIDPGHSRSKRSLYPLHSGPSDQAPPSRRRRRRRRQRQQNLEASIVSKTCLDRRRVGTEGWKGFFSIRGCCRDFWKTSKLANSF